MSKKPKTVEEKEIQKQSVVKWGKRGGATAAFLTPLILMYAQVKPSLENTAAKKASQVQTQSNIKTDVHLTAIEELQVIADESHVWAEGVDADLKDDDDRLKYLEAENIRLRAITDLLMTMAGDRRRFNIPEIESPEDYLPEPRWQSKKPDVQPAKRPKVDVAKGIKDAQQQLK